MKTLFIYNPHSGKGKIEKHKELIENTLRQRFDDVETYATTCHNDAFEYVLKVANEFDYIIVGGGDGTLNEVVNALMQQESKAVVGYIPCGTMNDVAKTLKIPKNIHKALDVIVNGRAKEIDTFRAGQKFGTYVCCSGVFTNSSYATKQGIKNKFGKIAYFFGGAKQLFSAKPFMIKIKTENKTIEKNCAVFFIINSKSVAGFKVNKGAKLDDGLVDLVVIENKSQNKINFTSFLTLAKLFLFGVKSLKKSKKCVIMESNKFDVECDSSQKINIDGENLFNGGFEYQVKPKALKIITKE